MALYDYITAKPELPTAATAAPLEMVRQMVAKVEKRAFETLQPYAAEMASQVIIDPYAGLSPADSDKWLALLSEAKEESGDLYARLFYIRGAGTILVQNERWGYVLEPVVSADGWPSLEQYNLEKRHLLPHREKLVKLLRRLAGGCAS